MSWSFGKKFFTPSLNRLGTPNLQASAAGVATAGSWTKVNANDIISASTAFPDPSGGSNVFGFIGLSGSSATSGLSQAITDKASMHTFVVRAKAGDAGWLYIGNTTGTNTYCYFNVSTGIRGTVGAGSALKAAYSTFLGNGWYDFIIIVEDSAVANTWLFSPVDADNSRTLTGNASTVDMYFSRCGLFELGAVGGVDENKSSPIRVSPGGSQLVGGTDGVVDHPLTVSMANKTRTIDDKTVLVQHLDSTGAVLPSGTSVTTAPFVKVTDAVHTLAVQPSGSAIEANGVIAEGTDGTYGRAMKVGADGAVYVEQNSLLPGEDASNGWRSVSIKDHNTLTVSKVISAGFTAETDIVDSIDVSKFDSWTVYVKNTSANAFTACNVKVSDDGSTWYTLTAKDADETVCQTLGGNLTGVAYMCNGAAHKYLKVTATASSNITTTTKFVGRY